MTFIPEDDMFVLLDKLVADLQKSKFELNSVIEDIVLGQYCPNSQEYSTFEDHMDREPKEPNGEYAEEERLDRRDRNKEIGRG